MTFTDVFNNLSRMFGREKSGETAKERLRLVLMSDHLSLAPDLVEQMKQDLVAVVSRFEHQDSVFAMLANVPIISVNRTPSPPAGPPRRRRRRKRVAQQNGQLPQTGSQPAAGTA